MSREGRKRLSVDLPEKLHAILTEISKKRNCTITKLVIRALVKSLVKYNRK